MADDFPTEKPDAITIQDYLKFLDFYRERLKYQREITDRWFGYYLLTIGSPFPALVGLLQVREVGEAILFKSAPLQF